ncbi:hypothetical protein CEUSTIGMA_g7254.t1 [Chlamydomonas eustigma]|uniref:Carbonic anhydrase n=1 Tax=Chlamydomonas eustigma TaxID=1157962 RepID=A0A250X9R4_9CHLO|nr:hypothetical protein CEUSTIGMA_g7254.t1 [Chlamydomonas eustigma]|eukprot:GAX79814.1 hypothetical protein CEUSTIGMA_g7254.t1 [Chlamydomonas eustigma]
MVSFLPALRTDLNVMSCMEFAVAELKVKVIICCGHYGCGAVKGALKLPIKAQGFVNCWINDIRECRDQHHDELKALSPEGQLDRLCELNVMRQTFHVCTSPVVQNAWDKGQDLAVYGVIYSLKDGLLRKLVGPMNRHNVCLDVREYKERMKLKEGVLPSLIPDLVSSIGSDGNDSKDKDMQRSNTTDLIDMISKHADWS